MENLPNDLKFDLEISLSKFKNYLSLFKDSSAAWIAYDKLIIDSIGNKKIIYLQFINTQNSINFNFSLCSYSEEKEEDINYFDEQIRSFYRDEKYKIVKKLY
jgi:hypothetical protein